MGNCLVLTVGLAKSDMRLPGDKNGSGDLPDCSTPGAISQSSQGKVVLCLVPAARLSGEGKAGWTEGGSDVFTGAREPGSPVGVANACVWEPHEAIVLSVLLTRSF